MIQENKIPWLKDVNTTWQCFQVKRGFETVLGKMLQPTQRNSDDIEVPYLKALHIHWDGIKFEDLPKMWANQSEIEQLSLKQGDLIVCEGGEVGRGTMLNHQLPSNCIIQNSLHRVRNKELGETRFLRYILQSASDIGWLDVLCNRATIRHFTVEKFSEFWIAVPSKKEQKLIADYLDRETTQIDNLIAAKEQMLTLLEEKREALISHAVTRGLDPNVSFKRSGLDWLGDIPQHWQFCQIRRLSPVKRGASPRPIDDLKYFDDDGEFSWVRISDVTASRKYLTQTTEKLSVLGSSLSVKLYPETFFVSIAASVGKPIITKIKCCIHDGFVYFPYLRINNNFLYYLFEGGQLFKGLGKLGTQLNLNTETIGSIHIPIPPDDEIEMIVDFLDYETAKIDKLVAAIKDSITLLKERRSALITAAVTGQIALEDMTS